MIENRMVIGTERYVKRRHRLCDCCGEEMTQEYRYNVGGELLCVDCFEGRYMTCPTDGTECDSCGHQFFDDIGYLIDDAIICEECAKEYREGNEDD